MSLIMHVGKGSSKIDRNGWVQIPAPMRRNNPLYYEGWMDRASGYPYLRLGLFGKEDVIPMDYASIERRHLWQEFIEGEVDGRKGIFLDMLAEKMRSWGSENVVFAGSMDHVKVFGKTQHERYAQECFDAGKRIAESKHQPVPPYRA